MTPIFFKRWLPLRRSALSAEAVRQGNEAYRFEIEGLRAAREASQIIQTLLVRRIEFLESAHRTATRLIRESSCEHDRTRTVLQETEARLSLAVSDRLLATRLNEELLREVQRLAHIVSSYEPDSAGPEIEHQAGVSRYEPERDRSEADYA
ncbi:hypothetical protein GOFOIKOB_6505 [Methylobacterium tardum]|uniref:Uncharacterized protein n=1 Tax=Methylobacterium tardum TaxID=374432 RepID=A0AA37WNP4_9HYPH|nr:hypothetical protein [Methylobacterium tardum]URD37952.1 hypothetical protein M6G65_05480 [Methylobacterium tardum]GJE53426.1 hypothetical protein GOFOIKOB_6505 [Methylobacterium tardum]GLS68005.1 hypothetical protein GCM10007890_00160 [Methylobacterium tardum]